MFRINIKLHSKLSRTFWNLMKLLNLVRRAECLNCTAHGLLIHNNGLLSVEGKSEESLDPLWKKVILFL